MAFLDADDRWLPEKLERQVEHLRTYPEVGLVTGSEWQVDAEGQANWLLSREPAGAEYVYHRILVENFIGSPSSC